MNKDKIIKFIKSKPILKVSFYFFNAFSQQLQYNIFKFIYFTGLFFVDYFKFKAMNKNNAVAVSVKYLLPQLADKTANNPVDHIYVLQNAWACAKLFKNKPTKHVDVGSSVSAVAIMSQFTPTTVVDIRGIDIQLHNLSYKQGSILNLPFKNNSIESISSICVVEHIGLGRYNDTINTFGTEQALKEVMRVVKKGGSIILSVPVGLENKVKFNAHREFAPDYFIKLMNKCRIMEQKFIVGNKIKNKFNKHNDNVVGLFEFIKL